MRVTRSNFLPLSGGTLTGNITFGTDLGVQFTTAFLKGYAAFLALRNATDTGYGDWRIQSQEVYGDYKAQATGLKLQARNADDATFILEARDNGAGLVEIARLAGAADAYFQATLPLRFNPQAGAPGVPVEGMVWYLDADDRLYLRKAASTVVLGEGVRNYAAGTILIHTSAGVGTTNNLAYEKHKELYIPGSGTLRIAFDLIPAAIASVYGQIWRNGVAVGTERSVAGGGAETNFSEDIAGWIAGDLLQIYIHRGVELNQAVTVNDLKLYISDGGYDILTVQDT